MPPRTKTGQFKKSSPRKIAAKIARPLTAPAPDVALVVKALVNAQRRGILLQTGGRQ